MKTERNPTVKKTDINLIPQCINPTPDYYCTWQTQLYATCDGKPPRQRAVIGERALFDREKPFGWAYFYEKARSDLFLVMDDSWDVPLNGDRAYYGSLVPDPEKFPESTSGTESAAEALKRLTDRIRALGWKGLGGWVHAGEAAAYRRELTTEQYWTQRLQDADVSGFAYWKVDWGKKGTDAAFRRMLTELGRRYAPRLTIEHAVTAESLIFTDVYRTYDVPALFSIPMTVEKLAALTDAPAAEAGCMGLVNCEDEAYIAAAGGFSMGIMRHPHAGAFPDGREDMSFPSCHRNLKTKMYEILRAVRFHRIAPAFARSHGELLIDSELLTDTWQLGDISRELEEWWLSMPLLSNTLKDGMITRSAPARLSRGCPLPSVEADENGEKPFVVAAHNPNGVLSVATLGRTVGRSYFIPRCNVSIEMRGATTLGIFGEYRSLTLSVGDAPIRAVLLQDLAGESAYDITDAVLLENGRLIVSGELIHKLGTEAQPSGDTSEPGALLSLITD